ncbi:MAG TPA: SnoaL-like domain-containing protein [Candidatus Hydrogenedentes bacterium]|nr:SnoaL-like domain-containing protein [Candidatus Hydrogenedentota bacterium]
MAKGTGSTDEAVILDVIDSYPRAFEFGDPSLWESLFWLEDPQFTVIENDRPHLMGREYVDFITGLIRQRGPQPSLPRWYNTEVHLISPDIAYATSLRDEVFPGGLEKTSRITLVLKKRGERWKILHAHFSLVPG